MEGGNMLNTRKHRDFAVKKFHVITETFLSLVGTDTQEDITLLVQVFTELSWLSHEAVSYRMTELQSCGSQLPYD